MPSIVGHEQYSDYKGERMLEFLMFLLLRFNAPQTATTVPLMRITMNADTPPPPPPPPPTPYKGGGGSGGGAGSTDTW